MGLNGAQQNIDEFIVSRCTAAVLPGRQPLLSLRNRKRKCGTCQLHMRGTESSTQTILQSFRSS